MKNELYTEILWSKGRTREEMAKQTSWSSSKDYSGLSGLKFHCYSHNKDVQITAITSQGVSHNKYLQIPVDKIDEMCNALIEAKRVMESKSNEVI
tara:strand:+ start:455 stop:739 length:285 start_codon:yes stop_codon:yes gene_type:complete